MDENIEQNFIISEKEQFKTYRDKDGDGFLDIGEVSKNNLVFFFFCIISYCSIYLNYRLKIGYYLIILIMLKLKVDILYTNLILMLMASSQKKKY